MLILLDGDHVLEGQVFLSLDLSLDHLADALGAVGFSPFPGDAMRVAFWGDLVVGGHDETFGGVEHPGPLLWWDPSAPVPRSIARDRIEARMPSLADRELARPHITYVAIHVGVDEVLRGGAVRTQGLIELVPVPGVV